MSPSARPPPCVHATPFGQLLSVHWSYVIHSSTRSSDTPSGAVIWMSTPSPLLQPASVHATIHANLRISSSLFRCTHRAQTGRGTHEEAVSCRWCCVVV